MSCRCSGFGRRFFGARDRRVRDAEAPIRTSRDAEALNRTSRDAGETPKCR